MALSGGAASALYLLRYHRLLQQDDGALDRIAVHDADRLGVREAFEQLSLPDQDALYLFVMAEFRTQEIAGKLDLTPGAVRQRLFRTRERFRRHYAPDRSAVLRQRPDN